MTTFLTYGVYSVRIASDLPVQSEYLPMISIYFFFGIIFTLISLIWFLVANYYSSKNEIPSFFICMSRLKISKTVPIKITEQTKNKCHQCQLCEDCELTKQKEKEKKSHQIYIQSCMQIVNYYALLCISIVMLGTNLTIWFSI